jgi:hypothetical protein
MDEVKSKALFTVLKPSSEWESNPMVGEGGGLERTNGIRKCRRRKGLKSSQESSAAQQEHLGTCPNALNFFFFPPQTPSHPFLIVREMHALITKGAYDMMLHGRARSSRSIWSTKTLV